MEDANASNNAPLCSVPAKNLDERIASFYANTFLHDVLFLFPSESSVQSLPAHRIVLSIRSERFSSYFQHCDAISFGLSLHLPIEISIQDISFQTFSLFLRYLYQPIHPPHFITSTNESQLKDLIRIAFFAKVPSLLILCISQLLTRLETLSSPLRNEKYLEFLIFHQEVDSILFHDLFQTSEPDQRNEESPAAQQCKSALKHLEHVCFHSFLSISHPELFRVLHLPQYKTYRVDSLCHLLSQRTVAPLVLAAQLSLERAVMELLRLSEPVNKPDENGILPLTAALASNELRIARRILMGFDAPLALLSDRIPLFFLACYAGELTHCQILIKNADVNEALSISGHEKIPIFQHGQTPLHIASLYDHVHVIQLLLEHHAAANLQDDEGNTALHHVQSVRATKALLAKANPNIPNQKGQVPLHIAAARGSVEIAELLLAHGAEEDVMDVYCQTPFLIAAKQGHTELVLFFLRRAETEQAQSPEEPRFIDQMDMKSNTALHLASMCASPQKILILLLENGADPNKRNWFDYTPLHVFCAHHRGPATVIQAFVEHGADIQAQSADQSSALHLAVGNQSTQVAIALIQAGAQVHLRDAAGRDVLDLAMSMQAQELRDALLQNLIHLPTWIPNDQVAQCSSCHRAFGIATRKHHCRHCGRIICNACSSHLIPLLKFQIKDASRVCDTCFAVLGEKE